MWTSTQTMSSSSVIGVIVAFILMAGVTAAVSRALDKEPGFDKLARNITVVTGQNAVLPCAVAYKGNHSIAWMHPERKILSLNDRRIIDDSRFSVERPFKKEWNLHIREVTIRDQGTYQCQINTKPVAKIRMVTLEVFEPPQIIERMSSPSSVSVMEGDTVELICNVTGTPTPTVTWYKTNQGKLELGELAKREQIGKPGEVLVIHNVTRYCDDTYQCVAFNNVDPAARKSIHVNVEFPPEVFLPTKRLRQRRSKDTVLECQITGYPLAVSTWKRNGNVLRGNSSIDMYKDNNHRLVIILKLSNLRPEDFGQYECDASNKLGQDSEVMYLDELLPPTTKPPPTTKASNVESRNRDHSLDTDDEEIDPEFSYPRVENGDGRLDPRGKHRETSGDYPINNKLRNPEYSYETDGKKNAVISDPSKDDAGHSLHYTMTTIPVVWFLSLLVKHLLLS